MVDVVDKATRSRMMSGIRGKNTKPELQVRRALFAEGLRYRLHARKLPGRPDIALPKFNALIFVHGCFWHCHECSLFKWPRSNTKFWKRKLVNNRKSDEISNNELQNLGWRIAIVWECALKGPTALAPDAVTHKLIRWIRSSSSNLIIRGYY